MVQLQNALGWLTTEEPIYTHKENEYTDTIAKYNSMIDAEKDKKFKKFLGVVVKKFTPMQIAFANAVKVITEAIKNVQDQFSNQSHSFVQKQQGLQSLRELIEEEGANQVQSGLIEGDDQHEEEQGPNRLLSGLK